MAVELFHSEYEKAVSVVVGLVAENCQSMPFALSVVGDLAVENSQSMLYDHRRLLKSECRLWAPISAASMVVEKIQLLHLRR